MSGYSVAIVGATGLVGSTLLSLLTERNFPVKKLHLLASNQSAGKDYNVQGENHRIEDLSAFDFNTSDFAFFCVGNDLAAQYAPKAAACGNIVIDKSSHFRYQDNIPLVVPEVNGHVLQSTTKSGIVSVPNCSTIPIAVALKPILDAVGLARVNVATYQSVSGSGKDAITELKEQTASLLKNESVTPKVYKQQIAFNLIPHIDETLPNGYTREEMKVIWELRKIFNRPELAVNTTAVRVPVFYGHSAAVHIETETKISAQEAARLLAQAPGVRLIEGNSHYPTPVSDAAGQDAVFVGRIREDISHPKGLNLWVVADNLRKGAALNGIQIAEHIVKGTSST